MRSFIASLKLLIFLLSSLLTIAIQTPLLFFTKGPVTLIWPKIFHSFVCWTFGVKVIVEGEICTDPGVVYMGNHISYLDVQTLGSVLKGCFVAKKEIESWPFFGLMGKQGGTLYIDRSPQAAEQTTKILMERLKGPRPLIIFAEGTSSNGKQILPFKSSLFQIFLNQNFKIQPFTVSLMEFDGHADITDEIRDEYTWHSDMTLIPHLCNISKKKGAVVKFTFQKPVITSSFNDRKLLSMTIYEAVVKGLDLSPSASYGHNLPSNEADQNLRREHASNAR